MAVAADHGLAGLGIAEVGSDDMDDSLEGAEPVVQGNTELGAVSIKRVQLFLGYLVGDRQGQVPGRSVVVRRGDRQVKTPDFPSGISESVKGLS